VGGLDDFARVFEQLPEGVLLYDMELRVVAVNARLVELAGFAREHMLALDLTKLADGGPTPSLRSALAGHSARFQAPYRATDGRHVILQMRTSPLRGPGGEIEGGIALVEHIAPYLLAPASPDEAVSRSIEDAPLPAYIWQREGDDFVLRGVNHAAMISTQRRVAALVGQRASQVYGPSSQIAQDFAACLATGTFTRTDVEYELRSTKESRRFTITYVRLSGDTLVVYTEDVTVRARLEEQVRQAQRMDAIGQVAAGVAHDFNNLVAAIESAGAALASALGPASPHLREVTEIQKAGASASALLRQLLSMSHGQHAVTPAANVDLSAIVRGMEPMLRRLIPERIAVTLHAEPGLGRVRADPTQMEQLVLNLALNGRDAISGRGALDIAVRAVRADDEARDWIELCVTDDGAGMDATTRARAFEPFFSTKGPSRGTGMGLATVYAIVQRSGGTIGIDSELGRGTSLRVLLPRQPVDELPENPASAPSSRATCRVLLVEDTAPVRRACRRTLASLGFEVMEAASEDEALRIEAASASSIELLLSDVHIPERGGRALYETLRTRRPGLRVLYMSGQSHDDAVRKGAVPAGAAFLQKPFAYADLVGAVRGVLEVPEGDVAAARGVR
jgi:signal transduction histidine kinase/ActR/RegA family two-component response regulator